MRRPFAHISILLLGFGGYGLLLCGCLHFQTSAVQNPLMPGQYVTIKATKQRIRIYERGRPSQPAVVLIHGYGSAGTVWRLLTPELERLGYRTLALDLPGFGHSDKYQGNYKTTHIADLVEEVMRQKGIAQADLIAHSWGSSVALALTLRHPKRVRRVVINSGWIYSTQIVPVLRWSQIPGLGELIYSLFFKERPADKFAQSVYDRRLVSGHVLKQIREDFKRPGYLAAALAVARGMKFKDIESRYRTIRKPSLLLWGKQDRVSLPFYGRRLASELPKARLLLIDRCGHIPMIERPYQVNRAILDFFGPAIKMRMHHHAF